MSTTDELIAELDQRVAEKLAAILPVWELPDEPVIEWGPVEPLPEDWPQFPRERWCILPAARVRALCLAEKLLEQNEVGYAAYLYHYGGKMRMS